MLTNEADVCNSILFSYFFLESLFNCMRIAVQHSVSLYATKLSRLVMSLKFSWVNIFMMYL